MVSVSSVAGAFLIGGVAWYRGIGRAGGHVTVWDVAGLLAFVGFAAGMLCEPEQIVQLFGSETPTR